MINIVFGWLTKMTAQTPPVPTVTHPFTRWPWRSSHQEFYFLASWGWPWLWGLPPPEAWDGVEWHCGASKAGPQEALRLPLLPSGTWFCHARKPGPGESEARWQPAPTTRWVLRPTRTRRVQRSCLMTVALWSQQAGLLELVTGNTGLNLNFRWKTNTFFF